MLSTASFFGGMLLMRLLIALTHLLDPEHDRELLGQEPFLLSDWEATDTEKQHIPGPVDIPVAIFPVKNRIFGTQH